MASDRTEADKWLDVIQRISENNSALVLTAQVNAFRYLVEMLIDSGSLKPDALVKIAERLEERASGIALTDQDQKTMVAAHERLATQLRR